MCFLFLILWISHFIYYILIQIAFLYPLYSVYIAYFTHFTFYPFLLFNYEPWMLWKLLFYCHTAANLPLPFIAVYYLVLFCYRMSFVWLKLLLVCSMCSFIKKVLEVFRKYSPTLIAIMFKCAYFNMNMLLLIPFTSLLMLSFIYPFFEIQKQYCCIIFFYSVLYHTSDNSMLSKFIFNMLFEHMLLFSSTSLIISNFLCSKFDILLTSILPM